MVPEQFIIRQNLAGSHVYFTSAGYVDVFQLKDQIKHVYLGQIGEGNMIGEDSVINDILPKISVKAKSYSTLAMITREEFKEMLQLFPEFKESIAMQIIDDPYDIMRDEFVDMCRNKIPYFFSMSDQFLIQLYNRCNSTFYGVDELLFECGGKADSLYIVINGVIEFCFYDGVQMYHIDISGSGTTIGVNNVLN